MDKQTADDVNMLLANMRNFHVVDLVARYYAPFNSTAPPELLREQIDKLQEQVDKVLNPTAVDPQLLSADGAYEKAANAGVEVFRKWMEKEGITANDLPDSPWDLPTNCPLWTMGLSMAQSLCILGRAKEK